MTKALFYNHYNTTRVPFLQKNLDPGTKDLLVLLFLSRSRVVYKGVNIYMHQISNYTQYSHCLRSRAISFSFICDFLVHQNNVLNLPTDLFIQWKKKIFSKHKSSQFKLNEFCNHFSFSLKDLTSKICQCYPFCFKEEDEHFFNVQVMTDETIQQYICYCDNVNDIEDFQHLTQCKSFLGKFGFIFDKVLLY